MGIFRKIFFFFFSTTTIDFEADPYMEWLIGSTRKFIEHSEIKPKDGLKKKKNLPPSEDM